MPLGENSSLKIGQIIYVLSNKAQKIIPAIVVEEMVVKKLSGNETSWKVSVGPKGKEKIVDSKRLDGELYSTLEEVESVLKQRLDKFIEDMVKEADKKATVWYGKTTELLDSASEEDKIDPNSLVDDEPTSSEVTQHLKQDNLSPNVKKATAAKEMRNKLLAAVSDDVPPTTEGVIDSEEIVLPDGKKVKVNIRAS